MQDYARFLQEKVLFYCKNQNPAGFTEILQDFCKNLARLTCTDPAGSCKMVSTGTLKRGQLQKNHPVEISATNKSACREFS